MVYYGTSVIEAIEYIATSDPENIHYITLTKSADAPTFYVECCCDPDWYYEFVMESNSDYERVKMAIMDAVYDAECAGNLLADLTDLFESGFDDILLTDDDCECCCGMCNKHLN